MTAEHFADPLRFLEECHGRIRERLALFRRTAAALRAGQPVFPYELTAALLFFRSSGRAHTEDEEQTLFPRLRERLRARGEAESVARLDSIEAEHREHEELWARLETALLAVDPGVASGDGLPDPAQKPLPTGTPEARAAAALLAEVSVSYEAHIPLEDDWLYPLAKTALTPEDVAAISVEMGRRHRLGAKLLGDS